MFFTQEVVVAPRCWLVALGRPEWTRLFIWGYMQGRFNMKYMDNMIYRYMAINAISIKYANKHTVSVGHLMFSSLQAFKRLQRVAGVQEGGQRDSVYIFLHQVRTI